MTVDLRWIDPRVRKRRCICNTDCILRQITGTPPPLPISEINWIRFGLFTERNSDGTFYLVLRGNDLTDRFNKRIKDTDILAITAYIRKNSKRITKLDLAYNNITDVGFKKLLKKCLIKGRSSLINLNIMNNDLTEKTAKLLATYAKFIGLKYLRINGNYFGINGCIHIADFIRYNDTVEFIDIGQTGQTLTSLAPIITSLRPEHGGNEVIKVLDLSRLVPLFDRYQYETKWLAYHVEYLLERNKTIIELHMQKNEFTCHDVEFIVRGLRCNVTILYLDLGFNSIGDYGAELLGKYLKTNPSLILLNIAGNSINNTGARALSFGLPFSKIRALDVSNNRFTDRGLLDILNTLKKFTYLRFLNIWGNTIGPKTCGVIERMLLSGALFQHTIDVRLYEVDNVLYAAYYPNPANRNKHLYYCEMEFAEAQPIYHIKRNKILPKKAVKVDCKQRHKLDKTDKNTF